MFVVKLYGRGAEQPSKCVQVFSSLIIHDLFNDFSCCNEQSYLGKKGLPSPGIEPMTFRFPCRMIPFTHPAQKDQVESENKDMG